MNALKTLASPQQLVHSLALCSAAVQMLMQCLGHDVLRQSTLFQLTHQGTFSLQLPIILRASSATTQATSISTSTSTTTETATILTNSTRLKSQLQALRWSSLDVMKAVLSEPDELVASGKCRSLCSILTVLF